LESIKFDTLDKVPFWVEIDQTNLEVELSSIFNLTILSYL